MGALAKTSLEQWAVLAAVVDEGGYAQAAAALHRSQSAVSYAVGRLQEELDVPLLVIEGRKAVLTPHGQTLLQRARGLLRDMNTLELLARSLKQGWEAELRLVVDAAFPREHLLKIVAELQQLCPNTQMQLSDAVLSGADEAIADGVADVVVTTHVPSGYVGEFLLGRYCATTDPDEIAEGLAIVERSMKERTVRAGEEELFNSELVQFAARFQRVESIAFGNGKPSQDAIGVRFSVTYSDGAEHEQVVHFSAHEVARIQELEAEFGALLTKDKRLGLASSQLGAEQPFIGAFRQTADAIAKPLGSGCFVLGMQRLGVKHHLVDEPVSTQHRMDQLSGPLMNFAPRHGVNF